MKTGPVAAKRLDAGLIALARSQTVKAVWSEATKREEQAARPVAAERRDEGLNSLVQRPNC